MLSLIRLLKEKLKPLVLPLTGEFCDLETVGPLVGTPAFYAIPVTFNRSSTFINAINSIAYDSVTSGAFATFSEATFWTQPRPQCEVQGGAATSVSLDLEDFSGVFIVQAIGVAGGLLIKAALTLGRFSMRGMTGRPPVEGRPREEKLAASAPVAVDPEQMAIARTALLAEARPQLLRIAACLFTCF